MFIVCLYLTNKHVLAFNVCLYLTNKHVLFLWAVNFHNLSDRSFFSLTHVTTGSRVLVTMFKLINEGVGVGETRSQGQWSAEDRMLLLWKETLPRANAVLIKLLVLNWEAREHACFWANECASHERVSAAGRGGMGGDRDGETAVLTGWGRGEGETAVHCKKTSRDADAECGRKMT